MTRFEEVGVERQLMSDSKARAERAFRHSCELCCYRGFRIDCDRCSIAHTHYEVVAVFTNAKATRL